MTPKINRPAKYNVPALQHSCHYGLQIRLVQCIMPGMYQSRDIVFLGQLSLGTRGLRKFLRGHIVSHYPTVFSFFRFRGSLLNVLLAVM